MKPTDQQTEFYKTLRDTDAHILLEARAGTGKTTSCVESYNYPTPLSSAVSAGFGKPPLGGSACFCAFNKAIADELKTKVPAGLEAKTLHSICFGILRTAFPKIPWGKRYIVNGDKTYDWLDDISPAYGYHSYRDWRGGERPIIHTLVAKMKNIGILVHNREDLVWSTLGIDGEEYEILLHEEDGKSLLPESLEKQLDDICLHFNLSTKENRLKIYAMAIHILYVSIDLDAWQCIDFDDMIYIPYALGLDPESQYDLLYVDEAQDLNEVQKAMAYRIGKRLVIVGDRYQSIYGFRGADCNAIPNMEKDLSQTVRGLVTLPLTKSFRCPQKGIELANFIVPDIQAADWAEEGDVWLTDSESAHDEMKEGDMVLCRTNAPLILECYSLWAEGRKAFIQGRQFGEQLINLIKKLQKGGATEIHLLENSLNEYYQAEMDRLLSRNGSGTQQQLLEDKVACIRTMIERVDTVEDLIKLINNLFPTEKGKGAPDPLKAIRLSSIHRAKGLEADRVFLLCPEQIPHSMAGLDWELKQEANLAYVAITRFKEQFFFVGSVPSYFAGEDIIRPWTKQQEVELV